MGEVLNSILEILSKGKRLKLALGEDEELSDLRLSLKSPVFHWHFVQRTVSPTPLSCEK
jgi:hypothetical protein